MDAGTLLNNSLAADAATRNAATQQLEAAARDNFHGYMHTLAAELANESSGIHIRRAAGLAFKNALAARDAVNQGNLTHRWLELPESATAPLKQSLLSTLGSPQLSAGGVAAQCISATAAVELPQQRWPELIPSLLEYVGNQDNTGLRINTLQAVGYVCEVIAPEILSTRSNEILTAVVQGARKEEPSLEVQAAAMHALYNSLEFIRDNFEREGERNYIMQVVCEATQSASVTVQVAAFECLVRIMGLYYDKMEFYMERALFGLTVMGMRHSEEAVALQAIEFWCTVCEEEIDLAIEANEAMNYGETPSMESKSFGKMALADVLPVLLELLSQQNEDDDEDELTKSMAAGSCLGLLAQDVGDAIVPMVVPFVEAGFHQSEWQRREAAVMAFGSILDGPEPSTLGPLVTQALGSLINMMSSDPSLQVRDTVAWTLSKVTEVMLENIDPSMHLASLIFALVQGLEASPRTIGSCCSALNNLVSQLSLPPDGQDEVATSPISQYYANILKALMPVSERSTNESNSRSAAYSSISTYIASSAADTLPVAQEVALAMLTRQEALLGMHNQLVGSDDRNNWNDMQINICVVLQSWIQRSPTMIEPFADRIMTNLLQLISTAGKHSNILEDAFATIGAVASAVDAGFTKYMEAFSPFLFGALASLEDWQAAQAGVLVISDISRSINENITPYAERIMTGLVEVLRSPVVHRSVKPNAITSIGEVALAVGPGFEVYLPTTMDILSQAGATAAPANDIMMIEFVWNMREAIIDAFIGIMNGLKTNPAPFHPYVGGIMNFVKTCWIDEERTDQFAASALGLIGDFAETYGANAREYVLQDWVAQAISYGRQRTSSKKARSNALYATQAIKAIPK